MKAHTLLVGRSARRFLTATLISASLLAGCGMTSLDGSGTASTAGVGSGGTGVFKASLSGSAADGYLINAVVFLDKNSNYQLDSGEPFAATDADGVSTIPVEPSEIGAYPIVALVIKGVAIDSVTRQTVSSNYVLSFPKESINSGESNFISPLSSHLRELLETGKYATTQQALDALAARMGLPPGTNILNDTSVAGNSTVQTTAKTIANLMSKQMDSMLNTAQALDIERYRAMMALIESNMKIVTQLNTPENIDNLNNSITIILSGIPAQPSSPVYKTIE